MKVYTGGRGQGRQGASVKSRWPKASACNTCQKSAAVTVQGHHQHLRQTTLAENKIARKQSGLPCLKQAAKILTSLSSPRRQRCTLFRFVPARPICSPHLHVALAMADAFPILLYLICSFPSPHTSTGSTRSDRTIYGMHQCQVVSASILG